MQIWIFFQGGAGGDGFVNLLEHSHNVVTVDQENKQWRIHRVVNGEIKFYAPYIDELGCFRTKPAPFQEKINRFTYGYLNAVLKNQNCVVASHDITLDLLNRSDRQDILRKKQIKVLLKTENLEQLTYRMAIKNLRDTLIRFEKIPYKENDFDIVLDIDKLQNDWQIVEKFCQDVGLDLSYDYYQQYQSLSQGETTFMKNNYNIERYQACINGDKITYNLMDIWNPTSN